MSVVSLLAGAGIVDAKLGSEKTKKPGGGLPTHQVDAVGLVAHYLLSEISITLTRFSLELLNKELQAKQTAPQMV